MFTKFIAVVVFSPIFLVPSVAAFAIGAWLGQIYIKAQLSVKREMSNARSPVLAHFGAAIAGIGMFLYSARGAFVNRSFQSLFVLTPLRTRSWKNRCVASTRSRAPPVPSTT